LIPDSKNSLNDLQTSQMKYIKKNENGSDTLEDENMNNEENKYLEVANFLNKVKKKDKT
jgi:hypothetical protein